MKRFLAAATAALVMFGCKSVSSWSQPQNPYAKRMFYEKYLNPADPFDARVEQALNALRADPKSAALHNELGQLLLQKGFPKDAEAEFERAANADSTYYPAWYNLGLIREARGNFPGARFAFGRAVHYKPGHAAALFQLGLMEEKRHNAEAAIEDYAKAITINHDLLDVRVNPRVLDSRLIHVALLRAYPDEHTAESMQFQAAPAPVYNTAPIPPPPAPSPEPTAKQIVAPAPPVTSPAQQPAPPPKPPGI